MSHFRSQSLLPLAVLGALSVSVVSSPATTLLVLGLDAPKRGEISPTTDVMLLVRMEAGAAGDHDGRIDILSIPRDTQAFIPGQGVYKINHAYPFGGVELAQRTIFQVVGLYPQKYVLLDFAGFRRIIDSLGGVTVDVRQEMKYEDVAGGLKIDLKPGVQRLNAEQSLGFVRWRTSDLARTAQHRQFLVALRNELVRPANLPKVPQVIAELCRSVRTNLSLAEATELAWAAVRMKRPAITTQVLPGRYVVTNDWHFVLDRTRFVVEDGWVRVIAD